ncbi:MAG: hypothetical protein IPO72_11710 [Saprospiraceae bacterium]|nr:hypothetical protein [Candidatus Vicinibacter affinis]
MLLEIKRVKSQRAPRPFQIFATDLSEQAHLKP